jgi:nicotinic acetylcholine receptor beta-3
MLSKACQLALVVFLAVACSDSLLTDEQRLLKKLMRNYDKASRPVFNASHSVEVKFSFSLIQICDMDERNQVLTTNVWLGQEWVDESLKWNASEYSDVTVMNVPCKDLWVWMFAFLETNVFLAKIFQPQFQQRFPGL